ncbi:MAG: hypothetical protein LBJ39_06475 [Tannerellaceae bacterium]|jgi:hypothetical protein|nr:hypothetical protein [Tannerellaceae bacterium]
MKKALFIFIVFAMALQVAFAQRGRIVTIYFHNGRVVKGELSKLPNEERFRLQTLDGSVFLFTSRDVREVLYEDGTRPGVNQQQPPQQQYQQRPPQQQYPQQQQQYQQYPQQQQQYQQSPPQQQYQQQQQAYPPAYQNQGVQPQQQQQLNRQQQNVRPQGNAAGEAEQIEEEVYDESYDDEYEDEYDEYDDMEVIDQKPSRQSQRSGKRNAEYQDEPNTGFIPSAHLAIDFGYTLGMGDSIHAFSRTEVTISMGYQFTPSLFVGAGTGIHLYSDSVKLDKILDGRPVDNCYLSYVFPVFADVRYTFSNGKIKPFAALKAGYSMGLSKTTSVTQTDGVTSRKTEYKAESLGLYLAPSIGAKFMLGPVALNIGAGYSMQMYNSETLSPTKEGVKIKKMDIMGGVTLRAGLEF